MTSIEGGTNEMLEWAYRSRTAYDDPFNEIILDITITSPSGKSCILPAFWAGGNTWKVRFISKEAGVYRALSTCSDPRNSALHHIEMLIHVTPSESRLPPRLQLSSDRRSLTDEEGKPFFWFADTWWMALSDRLAFPDEFRRWAQRRKQQEFNTIMLVAGLFPDMDSFDPRGKNEAGFPWEADYSRINPAYFDEADRRIACLIEEGLIPTILGSWGYYLLKMGETKMKQHWRYLVARWGCYPVVWCIAGEATMPFYTSAHRTEEMYALHEGWTRLARYIRSIEPFGNLITIHPTEIGREQLQDPTLIDFNLIQSGHSDFASVNRTITLMRQESHSTPAMPLILGEANYEGILKNQDPKMQRLTFWSAILNGSKGYSYGANGIWQVNTPTSPFGASPHGASWGDTPWESSLFFKGADQLALAKQLLERYSWWQIEPHPEWINPQHTNEDYRTPQAGGIPGILRIVYFYSHRPSWWQSRYKMYHLEPDVKYHAFFWNPHTGEETIIGTLQADKRGEQKIPKLPSNDDWVLVLEAT